MDKRNYKYWPKQTRLGNLFSGTFCISISCMKHWCRVSDGNHDGLRGMTPNICARDKTPPLPRGQTTSAFHQNSQQIDITEGEIWLNPLYPPFISHTNSNTCWFKLKWLWGCVKRPILISTMLLRSWLRKSFHLWQHKNKCCFSGVCHFHF